MKKALFFLSLVFSLLLAGGCAKEPLNLEGTRWSRINDGFGGFEYSRYDLSFSSGTFSRSFSCTNCLLL